MAKEKLNNLLGMKDFGEKDILKKAKSTKHTEVAKDILTENTGKDAFAEKMKGKTEYNHKNLHNLMSLDAYSEKEVEKDIKPETKKTKRTDVAKDVLEGKEYTGKDVFVEKPKSKDDVVDKKLHNLYGIDEFSEKEVMKDAKKTKRTDVAKDVLQEKKAEKCEKCEKEEKPKGLTAKQKKLPEHLQKAILKKQGK